MLIDLTHSITNGLPVYPGDPRPSAQVASSIEQDGFLVSQVSLSSHAGTHIDAPARIIQGGKRLADYPLERFIAEAVCFDVRQGLDVPLIATALSQTGLGVLFYSGASDYFTEDRYWHEYPTIPAEVQQLLIDKKVGIVGIDAGSFDTEVDFPVHKTLLRADILLIENLTSLGVLVGRRFELITLLLKLADDGAPVRALARTH